MKRLFPILFLLIWASGAVFSQSVFFNEVNYLSSINKTFVEIAGPEGTDLSGWEVFYYDDSGEPYDSVTTNETVPEGDGCNGFVIIDAVVFLTDPTSGLALVDDQGQLVQYITYGGTNTGASGPANGVLSENIGTQLVPDLSLQLTGLLGLNYLDFTWGLPGLSTPELVNAGQSFEDCEEEALPIELGSFSATAQGKNIRIQWHTLSEINHSHFILYHSTDRRHFEKIATVADAVNFQGDAKYYEFLYERPSPGINYFRLDQVDFDGRVNKSAVISTDFQSPFNDLTVFPNPASGKIQLLLEKAPKLDEKVWLTLRDYQGKSVMAEEINYTGSYTLDISHLKDGIYFMEIIYSHQKWNRVFVKNQE